jgi:hypothetical protein
MIIYMNLYKIKGVLGSWKLWFSYINDVFLLQNQNFGSFWPIFDIELKRKRQRAKPSRAENPSARALARASSARTHDLPNWKIMQYTLDNVILCIAKNFLETRENIKISTHPFYHIKFGLIFMGMMEKKIDKKKFKMADSK